MLIFLPPICCCFRHDDAAFHAAITTPCCHAVAALFYSCHAMLFTFMRCRCHALLLRRCCLDYAAATLAMHYCRAIFFHAATRYARLRVADMPLACRHAAIRH